jgi:hypothetical protein
VVSRSTGERVTLKSHRAATRHLYKTDRHSTEEQAAQEVDRQNAARIPHLVRRNSTFEIFGKVAPLVHAVAA